VNEVVFKEHYDKLNPAQKEAVDLLEGPVMVIAGPGTGKTKILTLRIANILRQTDTEPENILALTFTEAGVMSMRKALAEVIGSLAYLVQINTFHGFSNGIIKNYPESFPRIIGSDMLTDSDRLKIFEEIIESSKLNILRPMGDKFHYIHDIMGAISDLKREGVDIEDYNFIVDEWRQNFEAIEDLYYIDGQHKGKMRGKYADEAKNIVKNGELALIYDSYEKKLTAEKLYDYEDMIMEALKALRRDEELLLSLQEKHQYILADEHQDSNNAQNKILELLAGFHKNPNIFIVGDSKQAIFRFQGASLDNFYYFKNLYSDAKLITLSENYRSTQEILAGAYSLIPKDEELKSVSGKGNKIRVCEFANELAEEYFLVDEIKNKIDAGANPKDIAVIFKENKNGINISAVFEKYGIPFALESDNNLLSFKDIWKLIKVMKAVNDPGDEFVLAEAMHMSFFKIDAFEVYKVLSEARKARIHIMEVIKNSANEKIKEFGEKISAWQKISKNTGLLESAEVIITNSGIIREAMQSKDALVRIEKISDFYSYIRDFAEKKKGATMDTFMSHLSLMEEHGMTITGKKSIVSGDKVRLMTAHRSKGQEFDSVYIIKAVDGLWSNKKRPEKLRLPYKVYSLLGRQIEQSEKMEDERKLFYVAVTRAKKELTITYSKEGKEGRDQLPVEFIGEIRKDMIENYDTTKWDKGTNEHISTLFTPSFAVEPRIEIKNIVRESFEEKGLSATDINNYLECPWKYFYTGLFRIPEPPTRHLSYGTAVHAALKDFFDSIKERGARKDYLLLRFKHHLLRETLKETDYQELLQKGETDLGAYFEARKDDWEKDFMTEFYIAGIEIAPGVTIKGRIDRMETVGFSNDVIITDFKTGRVKSEKEIAGETKNSSGDIKRQLIFYKLLLDGYKGGKYKMTEAQIDFIEPNSKGKHERRTFIINEEEAGALKTQIIQIAEEIRSLAFWDKKCDEKDCPYCRLREGD